MKKKTETDLQFFRGHEGATTVRAGHRVSATLGHPLVPELGLAFCVYKTRGLVIPTIPSSSKALDFCPIVMVASKRHVPR